MKLPVLKPIIIEDGIHEGAIIGVEYREKPYKYTDIVIEFDEGKNTLKAGYPTFVMEESKLGLLMKRFGILISEGTEVDPDELIGKKCTFLTLNEKKGDKTYAKIVQDSVKALWSVPKKQEKTTRMRV